MLNSSLPANTQKPAPEPGPLALACTLAASTIPITGQPRLVYLLIEVSGGAGGATLPSNLGFILDTSDSMRIRLVTDEQFMELAKNGQAQEVMTDGVPAYQIKSVSSDLIAKFPRRIDYVSEALQIASEYLRSLDNFSVVAFAGRAHCMIPSTTGKEKARLQQAARELEYVRLGDETRMAEGIALAFNEVQRQCGKECASRLILLTDGHTRNVKECYEWAQNARKAGVKLTTMGIGVEFNEELLIPLADITGGNAYYIENPSQIPQAFRRELGAALNISYRNVEVKLQLPAGVQLRRVHRVLPDISIFDPGPNLSGGLQPTASARILPPPEITQSEKDGLDRPASQSIPPSNLGTPGPGELSAAGQKSGRELSASFSLQLGDYDPSAPQALLLELVIPPWQEGAYRLAQVLLAWDAAAPPGGAPANLARPNQRLGVQIQLSKIAPLPLDGRVMNIVEKVGAFKMGAQALEAAERAAQTTNDGEKGAATQRLRQAATRLLDVGEISLADTMLRQAETLERSGSMDPDATKRLRYESRRMTQRL